MIERQIDVIEWVAYLVSDGGPESADDGRFFGLLKLSFDLTLFRKLGSHLVKPRGEAAHFVIAGRIGHANVEVALGYTACCVGEIGDRACKSPHQQ